MSPELFWNERVSISQVMEGTYSEIVKNILRQHLGTKKEIWLEDTAGVHKIIASGKPFDIIRWFLSRCLRTNSAGSGPDQWASVSNGKTTWAKRWMNIANTLLMYEQGLTTKHTFIDTCFGLQHNGGIYFNKWWSTSGIKKVLDSNQRGDYCGIYKNTTQMVKNIVNKDISAMLKEACLCSNCGTN